MILYFYLKGLGIFMGNRPNEIVFTTQDDEEVVFQVIEQTRLGGVDYLYQYHRWG